MKIRMNKINLLIALMFSFTLIYAQDVSSIVKKADEALKTYNFDKAIKLYTEALTENPNDNVAKEKLANAYMTPGAVQNTNMALKLYDEVFSSGAMSPGAQLKYANILQSQNNFDKAKSVYNNFSNKAYSLNSFTRNLASGYFTKIAEGNSSVVIKNLEDINTKNSDFSPSYYRDGLSFVSTRKNRNKTGFKSQDEVLENFTDIFKAKLSDPKVPKFEEPALILNTLNQKFMQGPMTFTEDFGVMYITRSISKGEKSVKTTDDNKTVLMEICKVNYSNGDVNNWDQIIPVVLNRGENYQNFSYAHPAFLTGKGDEMVFSSNMPGGFGGTDLWYSKLVGTEWSTPVNLGPEINTAGEEMFPFVAKDGVLYFASSGLPGLGGLDIYKAKGLGGLKFGEVENLGAPFNSKYDDFGYIVNATNREGYLTSNRPGGKGLDDIYLWKTEETQVCFKVVDASSKDPIKNAQVKIPCLGAQKYYTDANGLACVTVQAIKNCEVSASADGFKNNSVNVRNVQTNRLIEIPLEKDFEERCKFVIVVLDKDSKQPIPSAKVIIRQTTTNEEVSGVTKPDGSMRIKGIAMNEIYEILASKESMDGSKYIGIPESAICRGLANGDSIVKYVYLTKASVGTKFKIENIYYDLGKWNINSSAAMELDRVAALMQNYPTMEIELGSHTDCRSSYKYNEDLSSKRAAAAVEYIVSKGISYSRLKSIGYGESQLLNNCACEGTKKSTCSETMHQVNRRTEFIITKF